MNVKRRMLALVIVATGWAVGLGAAERDLIVEREQSRVEVAVKATVDSFTGTLDAYDFSGRVDDAGNVTAAKLDFHFRDLHTGKAKRDEKMHEWQGTTQFPDAGFVLSSMQRESAAFRAYGRLTIHGVMHEVNFPVTITRGSNEYAIDGDAPVDVREFGLPIIRMFGLLKVDPVVHVRFHLQLKTQ